MIRSKAIPLKGIAYQKIEI
ncbi:unknown protein [Waddlia chondrophila 2032/99]|uniref:Uncharacterized protein n=1 Tax=Waddlia chondrophila 2032/99 TaxID=765953 RepID=F8LCF0_9BACT|nr:unknown protein [Waddlia chondrophila 2032/99]